MSCQANPLPSHIPVLLQAVSDVPRWYAVYTYLRHEKVVTEQLESRFVEAFLPTFITESRWKDRRYASNPSLPRVCVHTHQVGRAKQSVPHPWVASDAVIQWSTGPN
jgi:hypothetical protein